MPSPSESKHCQAPNCSELAKLQCPTCLKLGMEGSFFCSQDCFQKSWTIHKKIHKAAIEGQSHDPFEKSFRYTGPLRAVYPLSSRRKVPSHIPRPDYAETGIPVSEHKSRANPIKVLNEKEIEAMRVVCKIAREVLNIGAAAIRPGITTDEIDRIVHEATVERNAYPSPLNYYHFPKSCCTSVNEVICHGIPDQYVLKEGDIINLDISCYYNGFHGDVNETYLVGEVDAQAKKLVQTARECLQMAIAFVKPGAKYRDIGKVIQPHAASNGFSVVRTICGHGINQLFHCAPNVPHYANNKAIGVLRPGHVFTIEPMVNEGTWKDKLWPDNWTAVTADGKRSAQFEHTLLVTETGVEILT